MTQEPSGDLAVARDGDQLVVVSNGGTTRVELDNPDAVRALGPRARSALRAFLVHAQLPLNEPPPPLPRAPEDTA
ncbi:hypothetical protein [Actinokineospora enzanensis]|uniref:hypothetical protein n=1 Tax=Actinokineospora enzanensis TaxID=155975 RepID=UPI00036A2453|nr:hypothetical protein [Actinokineospora enzanensis]